VPKTSDSLEIFSYVFWQWDQYHLQRQSDLFVRTPINRNPRYPKQIARNRFLPTHLTSLIRKPRCPTPSRKFRNGYVIPVEKKRWTGLRQLLLNCLLNHNGRVKVYFPRTMNVTVADPAGRSYRSPVQFFRLNLILNAYLLMYADLLINKNNYESFILSYFTCSVHICLSWQFVWLCSLFLFPLWTFA